MYRWGRGSSDMLTLIQSPDLTKLTDEYYLGKEVKVLPFLPSFFKSKIAKNDR